MKTGFWKHSVCLFALAAPMLASLPAAGRPFQRADVAAEAIWVAHLDFDALRATTVGQYVVAQLDKPDAQAKFAAFQAIFSFDLRTQLHGVTLYSVGTSREDAVLLFYADFDPERLVTLAKAAKAAQYTQYKNYVIYSWLDDNKAAGGAEPPRIYAAIQRNRIVFGQHSDRVKQALDVLDGATQNLTSTPSFSKLGAPGDTSFVEAAASKLNLPDATPQATILKLAKAARIQVGENQGTMNATLTIEANDQEVAGRILAVAQGVVAAVELQQDKPEVLQLAKGLTLKLEGTSLVINFAYPAQSLLDILKGQQQAKEAQSNRVESGK